MKDSNITHEAGHALIALGAGILFAIGLAVSGMTSPPTVIAFLDIFGDWNPTLAFVIGAAIAVHAPIYWSIIRRRSAPAFATAFVLPSRRDIDRKLVGGAVIFGIGWGLGGFCPGPALVSLAAGSGAVWWFVGAMLAGMTGFHIIEAMRGG